MKIYIITCNNAYNYGAVLQAFALQNYLKQFGHDVKIIDYYPSNLRKISDKYKRNPFLIIARKILYFPDYHKSKIAFGRFSDKFLQLTKACHNIDDVERLPVADLYIAGSDQIWNARMKNSEEEAYFLLLKRNIHKISYAASIGMIDIEDSFMNKLKEKLSTFDAVSVREKCTSEVMNLNGIRTTCVIDPVFLLPAKKWIKSMGCRKINEKFVLVYALHHIQEIYDYAKKLANHINAKVYVVSVEIKEIRRGNDKFFWNPDVDYFISLIANATAVVSNSFHGISFACIFNKPVHIFDTEADDPRIANIVELLGLKNRCCTLTQHECLENEVAVDIQKKIAEERIRSETWLKNAMDKVERKKLLS